MHTSSLHAVSKRTYWSLSGRDYWTTPVGEPKPQNLKAIAGARRGEAGGAELDLESELESVWCSSGMPPSKSYGGSAYRSVLEHHVNFCGRPGP